MVESQLSWSIVIYVPTMSKNIPTRKQFQKDKKALRHRTKNLFDSITLGHLGITLLNETKVCKLKEINTMEA